MTKRHRQPICQQDFIQTTPQKYAPQNQFFFAGRRLRKAGATWCQGQL